ncbi:MAG: DUF3592 domain-containing protein [Myxococcota bacterium]
MAVVALIPFAFLKEIKLFLRELPSGNLSEDNLFKLGIMLCALAMTVSGFLSVARLVLNLTRKETLRAWLRKTGARTTARVLQVEATGMRINHEPEVNLTLEVQRTDGTTYQAQITRVVSHVQLVRLTPGAVVSVFYDRSDPSKVVLAEDPFAGVPSVQSSNASFANANASFANVSAPQAVIQVQKPDGSTQQVTANQLVSMNQLGQIAPGAKIQLLIDPSDLNKVTVTQK